MSWLTGKYLGSYDTDGLAEHGDVGSHSSTIEAESVTVATMIIILALFLTLSQTGQADDCLQPSGEKYSRDWELRSTCRSDWPLQSLLPPLDLQLCRGNMQHVHLRRVSGQCQQLPHSA